MKAKLASQTKAVGHGRHAATRGDYAKVRDSRKRAVRGLWKRNDRFYAQLWIEDPKTGEKYSRRFPLGDEINPVTSVPKAVAAMEKLKAARSEDRLKIVRSGKSFHAFCDEYLEACKLQKRDSTYRKERSDLNYWKSVFRDIPLKQITKAAILRCREEMLREDKAPRTVNLKTITLRNVLNCALDQELIAEMPLTRIKALKHDTRKRPYFPPEQIEHLAACAIDAVQKTGQQLNDFLLLLLYSGCREGEARRLRWENVNFSQSQLTVGAEGDTKGREFRTLDLNSEIKRHLKSMKKRRQPDSQWIFPSILRGNKDVHVKTFKEALTMTKTVAASTHPELTEFGFHDARHTFISRAVMVGIDYMTIAKWVSHRDGGVLIGKVYGHLADAHKKAMARKLKISN